MPHSGMDTLLPSSNHPAKKIFQLGVGGFSGGRPRQNLCCICSKGFRWDTGSHRNDRRGDDAPRFLPRILPCSHNACEKCLRFAVTHPSHKLRCNYCRKEYSPPESFQMSDFDKHYPINFCLIGLLCAGTTVISEDDDEQVCFVKGYLDKDTSVSSVDGPVEFCTECTDVGAVFCNTCKVVFCQRCFDVVHSKAKALRGHRSRRLHQNCSAPSQLIGPPMCSRHSQCKLDFFCIPCNVAICTDCLIQLHNGHKLQPIAEKNEEYLNEVVLAYANASNLQKKVSRSLKIAGEEFCAVNNNNTPGLKKQVKDHFLQLHSQLVQVEAAVLRKFDSSKRAASLNHAISKLNAVHDQITKTLAVTRSRVQSQQGDFVALTKELKALNELPCIIDTPEDSDPEFRVSVDGGIFEMIESHVNVTSEDSFQYSLYRADEVPSGTAAGVDDNIMTVERAKRELLVGFPNIPLKSFAPSARTSSNTLVHSSPTASIAADDSFFGGSVASTIMCDDDVSFQRPSSSCSSGVFNSTHRTGASRPVQSGRLARLQQAFSQPYAASEFLQLMPLESLTPGVSFSVVVSDVRSPSDFYVQRRSMRSRLSKLSSELNRLARYSPMAMGISSMKEGDIGMAEWGKTQEWCRCEILSCEPDSPDVIICYIDYGSTAKIKKQKVMALPQVLIDVPPMAIRCSLARIQPKGGEWDFKSTRLLTTMLNVTCPKSMVVLDTQKIDDEEFSLVRLVIEHEVCPVDVAMALVFLGCADLVDAPCPLLDNTNLKIVFREYHKQMKLTDYELDETVFELSTIVSPSEFYITIPTEDFSRFRRRIQAHYRKGPSPDGLQRVFWPVPGMAVAVLHEGKRWERAVITEPLPDKMFEVAFVDVGGRATIPWDSAQILDQSFFLFPPQAFRCSLLHVEPIEEEWQPGATDILVKLRGSSFIKVKTAVCQPTSTQVVLTKCGLSSDTCVNALLVEKGFAKRTGDSFNQVETPTVPIIPSEKLSVSAEAKTLSTKKGDDIPEFSEGEVIIGPDNKYRLKVTVLKIVSPDLFYLKFDYLDADYDTMYQKMNELFNQGVVSKIQKPWKPNDLCAVNHGGTWKRATVLKEPTIGGNQMTTIEVKFIDELSSVVIVPVETLKELPKDFQLLGERVFSCRLGGIKSPPGLPWPQIATSVFEEFVAPAHGSTVKVYILKMKNFGGDETVPPVELFSRTTPRCRAVRGMRPPPDKWVSLNNVLRNSGMAQPDEYTIWDSDGKRKYAGNLNVMEDEESVLSYLIREKFGTSNDGVVDLSKTLEASEKPRWWLPEPIGAKNFVGKVTYVGPKCEIYIQNYVSNKTLALINEECEEFGSKAQFTNNDWEVGDICLAKYWQDKKWYRAVIKEPFIHGSYLVQFVDYGNLEYVLPECLRLPGRMTMRAIQAHVGFFDGLAPIGSEWEKETLDQMHSFLADKLSTFCVRRLGSGFLGIVKMDLPDHTDALQEIIARGWGVYLKPPFPVDDANVTQGNDDPTVDETDSESTVVNEESRLNGTDTESTATNQPSSSEIESIRSSSSTEQKTSFYWWDVYSKSPSARKKRYTLLKVPEELKVLKVCVMALLSPTLLLVHIRDSDCPELALAEEEISELQKNMRNEAASQDPISRPYYMKECCCTFTQDGDWYRAVVVRDSSDSCNKVFVQYVDYGNMEERFAEDLKVLKEEWLETPVHAVLCRIDGYRPLESVTTKEINAELVECFGQEDVITAVVKEREGDCLVVELRSSSGSLVYQKLIDSGLLLPIDC